MKVNKYIPVLWTCLLSSCVQERLDSHSNRFEKVVELDSMIYTIEYRPLNKIMEQEKLNISDSVGKTRYGDLVNTAWFNIKMKTKRRNASPLRYNLSTPEEYELRYRYFLTMAANDIMLTYGSEKLAPSSYTFETNYNLAPVDVMVVGFELPDTDSFPKREMTLSYYDRVFHNGIIKSTYSSDLLNDLNQYSAIN